MEEKPIERLNYFNGQRLQAADFKLEQDYHMRVRRWLNRSLYSPGIASGLEVYAIAGAPTVKVLPGLAIDNLGREIILLDEQDVVIVDQGGGGNGSAVCRGPYLTIRYQEDLTARQDLCCTPGDKSGSRAAWGGPSRILAQPVLELNAALPNDSSGKIVLACVTLATGCGSVQSVDTSVRQYIGDASAAKVKQYALEGVRDIDANNSARVYFHIRGRQPTAVTLYLRGEMLPSLYYTEMGNHSHDITVNVADLKIPAHTHGGSPGTTGPGGQHTPTVKSVVANADASVWNGMLGVVAAAATAGVVTAPMAGALAGAVIANFVDDAIDPDKGFMNLTLSPHYFRGKNDSQLKDAKLVNMRIDLDEVRDHAHKIDLYPANGDPQELPLSGTGSSATAGVNDVNPPTYEARKDVDPLTFVADLRIGIDGRDVTVDARTQVVNNRPPTEDWTTFGDKSANHSFVINGTGEIRVDYLPGVVLDEGEHYIDLSVLGVGNGGRVHFNLYVE